MLVLVATYENSFLTSQFICEDRKNPGHLIVSPDTTYCIYVTIFFF